MQMHRNPGSINDNGITAFLFELYVHDHDQDQQILDFQYLN